MTHASVHPTSPRIPSTRQGRSRAPSQPVERLDGERIAASASAITINVIVVMLMLVPLAAPHLLPQAVETEVFWVPRDPPRLIEPIPVPVTTAPAIARPQPPQVRAQPVAPPVVLSSAEPGDIAALPEPTLPEIARSAEPAHSISPPQTGVQLQYASAPPPTYPPEALRSGQAGTVLLQVLVDTDGRPLQVDVARSSGHRSLDRAARRHVLAHWTFRPAVQDGRPVQAIGLVPVEFALR